MDARVLLVPECGRGKGLGHLERMLALADRLAPQVGLWIAVPAGDAGVRARVAARGHRLLSLDGNASTRALISATEIDPSVVVLDGYVYPLTTQSQLRRSSRLVVVDDLGAPCDCDLAINPAPGGEGRAALGARRSLGGARYALLGSAYLNARARRLAEGAASRSVLVATGAMDYAGLSRRVVQSLLERDATVAVQAVAGPDMDAPELGSHPRLTVLDRPSSLADALAGATVYAGAAGTTAVQAACVGVAAVISATVPNQERQAAALAAAGCAALVHPDGLADETLRLLDDAAARAQMALQGLDLVDGRGASRVATAVLDLIGAGVAG